jgi:hypothetical protein
LSYTGRNDLTGLTFIDRGIYGARIRRWTLCLLVGCAWCLPLASLQPPESAPKRIFGLYGPSGKSQNAGGRDLIRVSRGQSGQIGVAIKLYYANGHTCELNKAGKWDTDHVLLTADGLNEIEPCKLEAYFPKGGILLKDEGQRCARVYCGTRGKLDAVSLTKKRSADK